MMQTGVRKNKGGLCECVRKRWR